MNVSLIVTYDPAHISSCTESVKKLMDTIGVKPTFLKSKYNGIFLIYVSSPKEVIKKLKILSKKNKELFGKTHHYMPVGKWVSSKVTDMIDAVKSLVPKIGLNEKWKMELEKKYYNKYDYNELILKLTEVVNREKIDLKKPKKIIKVEIIGSNAAISLLKPGELLLVS